MNRITKLAGEHAIDLLFAVQQELLNDPERGDLIEGTGIYGKKEQATLTASDKKKIKAVVDSLRREELL